MTQTDFAAVLPLIIIAGTALLLLLVIAVHRSYKMSAGITLIGFAVSACFLPSALHTIPRQVTSLMIIDGFALLFIGLIIVLGIFVTLISYRYMKTREKQPEEYYLLLLFGAFGACVLAASSHFASFVLGLEILSVSLYILIAYIRSRGIGTEAALKYLVLAAGSSAFLLFGMALIYTETGNMVFPVFNSISFNSSSSGIIALSGFALMIVGIGFKLGVVPFHIWIGDVYDGSPATVTAFIASISKAGIMASLIRLTGPLGAVIAAPAFRTLAVIAVFSMFIGNLLALRQTNIKKMMAFSSIAHMGYVLVAVIAGGQSALITVLYYLGAYTISITGVFGVIAMISGKRKDAYRLEDYRGLAYSHPLMAGVLALMVISLAGIPITAGFMGKFFIFSAGMGAGLKFLSLMLVINSVIGFSYYLRFISVFFETAVTNAETPVMQTGRVPTPFFEAAALFLITFLILFFGIFSAPVMNLIQIMLASG
jgi:NADH-quinone oxidoreductase subunit N